MVEITLLLTLDRMKAEVGPNPVTPGTHGRHAARSEEFAQPDVVGPELAHEAAADEDQATVALSIHAAHRGEPRRL